MEQKQNRSSFSGKLGFVLSAAGASVGLGNIWRFPYLAAKYGGGIFLLIYIVLALTFGYTMIMAETALGRMTHKSPVSAYGTFAKPGKKNGFLGFGGWINAIIPVLIVPYYSVIGGWVIKYLFEYLRGNAQGLAEDGYFSAFIADGASAEVCFLLFAFFTLGIIFAGVRNGVERVSRLMMPVLVVLSVIIAVYSVTRPGALAGVAGAYLSLAYAPSWLENMTAGRGWIAVALVIFALWDPWRAMAGSYLFGGIDALGFNLQVLGVPVSGFILNMLPYIFTVLVLVLVLKRRGGRSASPQALGLSYDREER